MLGTLSIVFLSVISSPPPLLQAPDPERAARAAAFRYESLLRRRAPDRFGGGFGGRCDEIVGRFCFRFDGSPAPPPEPEHPDVTRARAAAIRAFRVWLSRDPGRSEAAGGVIRYLIEDGRASEAVPLARAHVWANRGVTSHLLLGLALHYTGDFVAAEAAFDSARSEATEEERDRLDDVSVLLEPRERRRYRDLDREARQAYNRRLWAFSDPSLRVPGNERRSAHYARQAWIRILSEAPRASGMLSWGDDHEELVLRYGVPSSRERLRDGFQWGLESELNILEIYDPHSVALVPSALLTEGVPRAPPPGRRPYLTRDTARTSYAAIRLHRLRGLEAQTTRIPEATGWTVRVAALLPPDTVDPAVPVAPEGLLAVLDTMGHEVAREPAVIRVRRDSATVLEAALEVPPGSWVYQVELGDDSTGLAGLARYRLDVEESALRLSDPMVSGPDTASDDVFPTTVLAPGQVVGVRAFARGLLRSGGTARYAVEWWLEREETGAPLGRALRWLGRSLGLVGEGDPVRVRWEASSPDPDPVVVTFSLDLVGVAEGDYRLWLRIRDRVSGREQEASRPLRLDARGWTADDPGPG